MTPMSSLNSSEDGGCCAAVCLHWEAGGVGVSWRWRAGGARNMEVSLFTGDCSNVGITYTRIALNQKQFLSVTLLVCFLLWTVSPRHRQFLHFLGWIKLWFIVVSRISTLRHFWHHESNYEAWLALLYQLLDIVDDKKSTTRHCWHYSTNSETL
jgi:hypothetical protein